MIGPKRHLIVIQQPVETEDDHHEQIVTWTNVASVYASIEPMTGREFFQSQELQADITHRIRIRYSADVVAVDRTYRATFDSRTFEFVSVATIQEKRAEIEIMARERV